METDGPNQYGLCAPRCVCVFVRVCQRKKIDKLIKLGACAQTVTRLLRKSDCLISLQASTDPQAIMSSKGNYTYYYFNARGRGEFIRWILAASGLPWEDKRFEMQEWQTLKPTIPGNAVPYLVTPEGYQLRQSEAIARYVAKKGGLVPTDDLAAYKCDAIVDTVMIDMFDAVVKFMPLKSPEERAKGFQNWNELAGPKFYGIIDQWVKESRSGYLVGDRMTWADLTVACIVNSLGLIDEIKASQDAYPDVKAFAERIAQSGKVQDYLKTRPAGMFQF
ncbi:hypothetical protein BOX15_Mlig032895g1 [Macrostomum lignano]|uniref:Uncharacterized protein n=2 Tax=Macrostomum lignano TaxID=282301 RepID=A0A267F0T2_9PLAT|nr:hypothetical protein BOX15_Mlig032895g1 [Macrostomum lignano]